MKFRCLPWILTGLIALCTACSDDDSPVSTQSSASASSASSASASSGSSSSGSVSSAVSSADRPSVTEGFSTLPINEPNASGGTFTGTNSIQWKYSRARGNRSLEGKALTLEAEPQAALTARFYGGMKQLFLTTMLENSNTPATYTIRINGTNHGPFSVGITAAVSQPLAINCNGLIELTLTNITGGSVIFDNIRWEYYTSPAAAVPAPDKMPPPFISSPGIDSYTAAWSTAAGATGYRLSLSNCSSHTVTVLPDTASTNAVLTGLSHATAYAVRVQPFNGTGSGPWSEPTGFTTVPAAPQNVTAQAAGETAIILAWDPVSGAGGYRVFRSDDSINWFLAATVPATRWTNTGLNAATQYRFRVEAYSSSGNSLPSTAVSASTAAYSGTQLPLDAWREFSQPETTTAWYYFSAENGAHYRISWNDAMDGDGSYTDSGIAVTGYRSDKTTQYFFNDAGGYTAPQLITALESGPCYLSIEAVVGSGPFALKVERIYNTPAAPQNLQAQLLSSTTVKLTWNPEVEAAGYVIYSASQESGPYMQVAETAATAWTGYNLPADTVHWYKIAATNTVGTGTQSAAVSVTTPPPDTVSYAGSTYTGIGAVTDTASPRSSSTWPLISVHQPAVRGFNADGYFTIAGSNGYAPPHQYALIIVKKDATSEKSYYKLSGDFSRRIWLPYGSGSYTVTVHLHQLPVNNLNWQGDNMFNYSDGSYYALLYEAVPEYSFQVYNTRNEDGRWYYPSCAVQSDDPAIQHAAQTNTAPYSSDYDKVKALHDFTVKHLYYDDNSLLSGQRKMQDALTALNSGKAVCEGYTSLFNALLRSLGYKAQCIFGTGGSVLHAWSKVYYNGSWNLIDTTWDDPGPNDNDPAGANLRHTYFISGDDYNDFPGHTEQNTRPFRSSH